MFSSHFRSWVMMVPRKRQDSTESTGEPHRMTEAGGAGSVLEDCSNILSHFLFIWRRGVCSLIFVIFSFSLLLFYFIFLTFS